MTTPPLSRLSDCGEIDAFSPDFSAFVFKIQANMNKAHRDRIAFLRVCSGRFEREREYYHMQSGKKLRPSLPVAAGCRARSPDEAYAGISLASFDLGLFLHRRHRDGAGEEVQVSGHPHLRAEHHAGEPYGHLRSASSSSRASGALPRGHPDLLPPYGMGGGYRGWWARCSLTCSSTDEEQYGVTRAWTGFPTTTCGGSKASPPGTPRT